MSGDGKPAKVGCLPSLGRKKGFSSKKNKAPPNPFAPFAQKNERLVALLRAIENVHTGTPAVLLATRTGDVVAWSRFVEEREPVPIPKTEYDHLIPEELRKQDDEATAGDPELGELLVAITAVSRLSRRFVPECFYSHQRRRQQPEPDPTKTPLYRVVGTATVFHCFAIGPYHLLAFYSDLPSTQGERARVADAKMATLLDALRLILYPPDNAGANRPPPKPPSPTQRPASGERR